MDDQCAMAVPPALGGRCWAADHDCRGYPRIEGRSIADVVVVDCWLYGNQQSDIRLLAGIASATATARLDGGMGPSGTRRDSGDGSRAADGLALLLRRTIQSVCRVLLRKSFVGCGDFADALVVGPGGTRDDRV